MAEERSPDTKKTSGAQADSGSAKTQSEKPERVADEKPKTGTNANRRRRRPRRPRQPGDRQTGQSAPKESPTPQKPVKQGQRPKQRPRTEGATADSGAKRASRPGTKRPKSDKQQQRERRPRPPQAPPEKKEQPEEILLQYSVHEMAKRPKVAAGLLAGIILIAWFVWSAFPDVLFGIVTIAILVLSVSAFLFPIRYKLTTKGFYYRNLLSNEFRTWDRFYDYSVYDDAVQLLFDYRTLRGRVQKGFLVYYDASLENREKLLEVVRSNIKRPERPTKPKTDATGAEHKKDEKALPED